MGSQLLDLMAKKQADPERAGDDTRAVEEEIPWFYATQQGVRSPLVQVGYRKICLAGEDHRRDEQVCSHHNHHFLQP